MSKIFGNMLIKSDSNITEDERTREFFRTSKVISNTILEYGVLLIAGINTFNGNEWIGLAMSGLWLLARGISWIYRFKNQAVYTVKETILSVIILISWVALLGIKIYEIL